ncbi:hypothetical protein EV421DRAFT_1741357, partial [Armillaria borealis]
VPDEQPERDQATIRLLTVSLEDANKAKLAAEKDRDFVREQYMNASGYVTTVRNENTELEKRAQIAENSNGGCRPVRATFTERISMIFGFYTSTYVALWPFSSLFVSMQEERVTELTFLSDGQKRTGCGSGRTTSSESLSWTKVDPCSGRYACSVNGGPDGMIIVDPDDFGPGYNSLHGGASCCPIGLEEICPPGVLGVYEPYVGRPSFQNISPVDVLLVCFTDIRFYPSIYDTRHLKRFVDWLVDTWWVHGRFIPLDVAFATKSIMHQPVGLEAGGQGTLKFAKGT